MTAVRPPVLILAAGESSRFWPLSTHGHKCLHRLLDRAIIEHTVRSLAAAGVDDIVIVQSPIARAAHFPHRTIADQLGDGSSLGVRLRYVEQSEPHGQGDAILQAATLLGDEFCVVQPENINAGDIVGELLAGRPAGVAGAIAAQERAETWMFGVLAHSAGRVTAIVEKPERGQEPSKLCNMGVYVVGQAYLKLLAKEPDHPLSNLRALERLAAGPGLALVESKQEFFPLKYPWHLFAMRDYLLKDGPFLGEGGFVDGAVSPNCAIERDAVIAAGAKVENCLIGAGSEVHSDLANTITGAGVHIGEQVTIKDTALVYQNVKVDVKGHTIDTGLDNLGTVIGHGTTIGDFVTIEPGVMIGAECDIKPHTKVTENVPDRTTVA